MESERITIHPEINSGKPSIRNSKYTVAMVLELLSSGINNEQILENYSFLEEEDLKVCLIFAYQLLNQKEIYSSILGYHKGYFELLLNEERRLSLIGAHLTISNKIKSASRIKRKPINKSLNLKNKGKKEIDNGLKNNEKKQLNLLEAGKKFKVGTSTIIDFLNENNLSVEQKPTSVISDSMYKALLFEFGKYVEDISDKEIQFLKVMTLSSASKLFEKSIDEIIKIIENNIHPRFYIVKLKNSPDQGINNIMLEVLEDYRESENEKGSEINSDESDLELYFLKEDNDYTDYNDSYCSACHQAPCMCSDPW